MIMVADNFGWLITESSMIIQLFIIMETQLCNTVVYNNYSFNLDCKELMKLDYCLSLAIACNQLCLQNHRNSNFAPTIILNSNFATHNEKNVESYPLVLCMHVHFY